jgi:hypothetical protein
MSADLIRHFFVSFASEAKLIIKRKRCSKPWPGLLIRLLESMSESPAGYPAPRILSRARASREHSTIRSLSVRADTESPSPVAHHP